MPLPSANGRWPRSRSRGPPAEHRGVERDHQRVAAGRLGPADQALDQLVGGRPVQLEPARRVAHRGGAVLHRHRRLVGEDHRHAGRRRGPGDREVGLVGAPAPARRPEPSSSGAGSRRPNSSTEVSRWLTSRSTRGTTAHRSNAARLARWVDLVARAARDVGVGAGVQRLLRPRLQRPGGDRHARAVAVDTGPVDLVLPPAAGPCAASTPVTVVSRRRLTRCRLRARALRGIFSRHAAATRQRQSA